MITVCMTSFKIESSESLKDCKYYFLTIYNIKTIQHLEKRKTKEEKK